MKIYLQNFIRRIIEKRLKLNIDPFKVGDMIQVCDKLRERERQRIQFYLGILQIKQGIGRSTIRTILSEFNGEIKIKCIFYLNVKLIKYMIIS